MMRKVNAIQIFYDYERLENRLPSREEFETAYYGQVMDPTKSRYYYTIRKRFLQEREEEC